jgi:hypothetical protein
LVEVVWSNRKITLRRATLLSGRFYGLELEGNFLGFD